MKYYTVHCMDCMCILGISKKKTWDKEIRCMDCGKKEIANDSQESLNVEKLDEMPDYETTDRVVAKDTRIPSNDKHSLIHPDSLIKNKSDVEDSWCE